jgi:hypothetical protein
MTTTRNPNHRTITNIIHQTRQDLTQLTTDLPWLYWAAWDPTRAAHYTAQPGRSNTDTGPDQQPGPTHDIGQGNHHMRATLHTVTNDLHRATTATHPTAWPNPPTTLTQLTDRCRWLNRALQIAANPDRPTNTTAVKTACRHITNAHLRTQAALTRDTGPAHPTAEPNCRICHIDPAHPRKGGRCHTCHNWHTRKGGERPAKAITRANDIRSAHDAQARRRARGEDHGNA